MKATDPATDWREIDEWSGGVGWFAHPDETIQRASHALDVDDGVVLVDPVDFAGLDDLVAERGGLRGTAVLLNRHTRDAASIARRHDAPVYVPAFMDDVIRSLDAEVEPLRRNLPGSEYGVHEVVDNPLWKEAMLYGDETDTLVVPEAVGTTSFFLTGAEQLGVHPVLRLTPPRKLGRLSPDRVLVGHGEGVFEDAARHLRDAISGSRRRAPRLYVKTAREFLL